MAQEPRWLRWVPALVAAYVLGLCAWVFAWPQSLPLLVVDGESLTFIKHGTEYAIAALFLSAGVLFARRLSMLPQPFDVASLLYAAVLMAIGELVFTQYTRVQTATLEALIRKPIKELLEELDAEVFWQIHRSTLVNTRFIAGVSRDLRGRQLVAVKGHNEKLEVSRSFAGLFKGM